ncbi:hypothetical protein MCOR25_000134 [Pyricularia grisea]|nr:hypothetical protein MCOR25_000134 [Pyricularia grisea]
MIPTLIHVSFHKEKAGELWDEWESLEDDHVAHREGGVDQGGLFIKLDAWGSDNEEWRTFLDSYGLSQDVQDAIMDPLLDNIRINGICAEWAKDTIEQRYYGLKYILEASQEREASSQHWALSGRAISY